MQKIAAFPDLDQEPRKSAVSVFGRAVERRDITRP
jgi:hypothetical protein